MRIAKEILGFGGTFLIIFTISFALLNFSAVKSLFSYYITGEKTASELNESLGEDHKTAIPLPPKGAKKLIQKEFPPLAMSIAPIDYRLVIPKIGINVPLIGLPENFIADDIWSKFEHEIQDALRQGVVHYPGTANPGETGNVFFTGHSSYYPWDKGQYKEVFANLNQLSVGDEYFVFYQQKKYTYKIVEKKEVRPSETHVLEQPKDQKLSTLMTCWPVGTALKRLVVVAQQS